MPVKKKEIAVTKVDPKPGEIYQYGTVSSLRYKVEERLVLVPQHPTAKAEASLRGIDLEYMAKHPSKFVLVTE